MSCKKHLRLVKCDHLSEELLQQREGPAVMEAPGFCRVTDVSSMKQQGQGFCFVYPANALSYKQAAVAMLRQLC